MENINIDGIINNIRKPYNGIIIWKNNILINNP